MTNMGKVTKVNIAEAKAGLSRLVQKAMMGEEVVIARDNKPLLRLVPIEDATTPRTPGTAKGQVWTSDDFDATPGDFRDYV
jgi:prevent-host-death family protein